MNGRRHRRGCRGRVKDIQRPRQGRNCMIDDRLMEWRLFSQCHELIHLVEEDGADIGEGRDITQVLRVAQEGNHIVDDGGVGHECVVHGCIVAQSGQSDGLVQPTLGQFQLPKEVVLMKNGLGLLGQALDRVEGRSRQEGASGRDDARSQRQDDDDGHSSRGQRLQAQTRAMKSFQEGPPPLGEARRGLFRGGGGCQPGLICGDALHQMVASAPLECRVGREL